MLCLIHSKPCSSTTPTEYNQGLDNSSAKIFRKNTTLIALVGATIGKTALLNFECTTNQNIAGLYPKNDDILDPIFLFYISQTLYPLFISLGDGGFTMASQKFIKELSIPQPTISEQKEIVSKIKEEQEIVNANKQLIALYEQKIQKRIAQVWGEE